MCCWYGVYHTITWLTAVRGRVEMYGGLGDGLSA